MINKFISLTVLLLLTTSAAMGQDSVQQDQNAKQDARESAQSTSSENPPAISPLSSQANEPDVAGSTALITQSSNKAMAIGSCLVVDGLVREFCNANPDNVSCQFQ